MYPTGFALSYGGGPMAEATTSGHHDGPGGLYQAFGLCIHSALALPELPTVDPALAVDARIRYGRTPSRLAGGVEAEPFIETDGAACLIKAPAGRLLVSGGATIDVEPATGASEADLRPYVLGSALALLCLQRGVLPLHASAVMVGATVAAFVGPSGAGKSTLAAGLAQRGFAVVCDDLCALTLEAGRPEAGRAFVWPGVTRIKLWPDSVGILGADTTRLERVPGLGKYAWTVGGGVATTGPRLPLGAVYCLRTDLASARLQTLRGPEAVAAVLAGVHRWPTAQALGVSETLFRQVVGLAGAAPVFDAPDPLDPAKSGARLRTIMASFEAIG
jgi:hypothetical protein